MKWVLGIRPGGRFLLGKSGAEHRTARQRGVPAIAASAITVATIRRDDEAYGTDESMTIGSSVNSRLTNDATSIVSRPNRTATSTTAVCTAANNDDVGDRGSKVIGGRVGEQPAPVGDDVVHRQSHDHRRHRERAPSEEHVKSTNKRRNVNIVPLHTGMLMIEPMIRESA